MSKPMELRYVNQITEYPAPWGDDLFILYMQEFLVSVILYLVSFLVIAIEI